MAIGLPAKCVQYCFLRRASFSVSNVISSVSACCMSSGDVLRHVEQTLTTCRPCRSLFSFGTHHLAWKHTVTLTHLTSPARCRCNTHLARHIVPTLVAAIVGYR